MIYLYKCKKCGHEQEVEHKMKEKNPFPCQSCSASPKQMKKLINTRLTPHISWSQWRVS